jgi:hypothetical protein
MENTSLLGGLPHLPLSYKSLFLFARQAGSDFCKPVSLQINGNPYCFFPYDERTWGEKFSYDE